MKFPDLRARVRTDVSFDEMADDQHHKGPSPLRGLSIGMITKFPLDYMHLVCLGVKKRMLTLWIKGPLNCILGFQCRKSISESLLSLRNHIPDEFARKPRQLDHVDRWKATEFRLFLLYTGAVVLKDKI